MVAPKRLNKRRSSIKRSFKNIVNQKANSNFSAAEKLHGQIRYVKYKEHKSGADYKRQVIWLSLLGEKRRIKELLNSYPTYGVLWRKISYIPSRGLMLKIKFVRR